MKEILAIEYAKLKKFNPIKVILLIYVLIVPTFMYVASLFLNAFIFPVLATLLKKAPPKVWEFPEIWKFTFYSASWFHILIGVIIVMIISNEFTYRTSKQNIIDGMTKSQVIAGKLAIIVILAAFLTIYNVLVALVFGFINSAEIGLYENIHYVFVFFFQTICYCSLALFFVILIRHTVMSILAFALYPVVEVIVGALIPRNVYSYLPLNIFASLTPSSVRQSFNKIEEMQKKITVVDLNLPTLLACSLGLLILFYTIAYLNLKKRDL